MAGVLERAKILVTEVARKAFDSTSLIQDLNTILLTKVCYFVAMVNILGLIATFCLQKKQTMNSATLPELQFVHACKALSGAIKYLDLVSQFQNGGQFTLSTLTDVNYMRLDSSAIKALHLLPDPLEGVTKEKCLSG